MVDLLNSHFEKFQWTARDWENIFWLAEKYGWIPQGTKLTSSFSHSDDILDYPDWDGNYFIAANQLITAADSNAWANALVKAFAHIPTDFCYPQKIIYAHSAFHTLESIRKIEEAQREQFDLGDEELLTIMWLEDFHIAMVPPTILVVDMAKEEDFVAPVEYVFSGKKKIRVKEFINFLSGDVIILGNPINRV